VLTTPGIGPVNSALLYLQRGHGFANFSGSIVLRFRALLWSAAWAVGRETFHTDGKILTDIAERKPTDAKTAADIVSKHVKFSDQNFISQIEMSWPQTRQGGGR